MGLGLLVCKRYFCPKPQKKILDYGFRIWNIWNSKILSYCNCATKSYHYLRLEGRILTFKKQEKQLTIPYDGKNWID